jgi:hypothetical protein
MLLTVLSGATDHEIVESVVEQSERRVAEFLAGLDVNPPDFIVSEDSGG